MAKNEKEKQTTAHTTQVNDMCSKLSVCFVIIMEVDTTGIQVRGLAS